MLINSIGQVAAGGATRRPIAAPGTGPAGPIDSVASFTQTSSTAPSLNLAAQAVSAAAQAAPAPGVARPGLEELRQMAERLQEKGLKLEHRPKILFFTLDYKESNPDKVAKLCEKTDRVRVLRKEEPLSVNSSDDLILLDALYGKGDVSQLSKPALARALLAFEQAYPGTVDAYRLYQHPKLERSLDSDFVRNGSDLVALAYLRGLTPTPEGLERPAEAQTLRALGEQGYSFVSGPLNCYNYASGASVTQDNLVLAQLSQEELGKQDEALAHVETMKQAVAKLSQSVGQQTPAAWEAVRGNDRFDLDTRLALAEKLFPNARHPRELFDGVLENAKDAAQLDGWVQVAARYDATAGKGHELEAILQVLKTGDELPSKEFLERFDSLREALPDRDAGACAAALVKHPDQPANPAELLPRLKEFCGRDTTEAFVALASLGRLGHDVELLASMVAAAPNARAAIAAYPTLQTKVPAAQRDFYLSLWKAAPTSDMEKTWSAVYRSDGTACAVRTEAWKDGCARVQGSVDDYSELLGSLPDGPELEWRADMLNRVVFGSQGRMDTAARVWEDFKSSSDLETAARFYEATGNQQQASRAAEILTRADLGPNFSYEAKRDALSGLIGALGGDVDQGLSAYRHLLSVSGPDLARAGSDYARLLTACGDEEKGRLAFGALRASSGSAESLALALQVHEGDLAAARSMWVELDKPDGDYPRSERVANLALLGELKPEETEKLLAWMNASKVDGSGRALVASVLTCRGEFDGKLALIQKTDPSMLGVLERMKEVPVDNLVEIMDVLGPRARDPKLPELAEALNQFGHKAEPAHATRLIDSYGQGDDYRVLGRLLSKAGSDFEPLRRSLGAGSAEGGELARNTRWFDEQLQSQGVSGAQRAWEAVRVPVGTETTDERQEQFARLGSLEGWKALTSWMQPGETLSEAVDAAVQMRTTLQPVFYQEESWVEMLSSVREAQTSGALERLTLASVADRLEKAITDATADTVLNSGRVTVSSVFQELCNSGGALVQEGEHHVVIGGVRVPTR